ncbi:hypothetical protein D3C86_2085640 [compost metagenome]
MEQLILFSAQQQQSSRIVPFIVRNQVTLLLPQPLIPQNTVMFLRIVKLKAQQMWELFIWAGHGVQQQKRYF